MALDRRAGINQRGPGDAERCCSQVPRSWYMRWASRRFVDSSLLCVVHAGRLRSKPGVSPLLAVRGPLPLRPFRSRQRQTVTHAHIRVSSPRAAAAAAAAASIVISTSQTATHHIMSEQEGGAVPAAQVSEEGVPALD